jgi:hypothetical protein
VLFDEFFDLERFATPATDTTRWRDEDFALRESQMEVDNQKKHPRQQVDQYGYLVLR